LGHSTHLPLGYLAVAVLFSPRVSVRSMTPPGKEYELTVEEELPAAADGAPRRARLTVRFPRDAGGAEPDEAELARTLRELADRLARASEASGVGRGLSSGSRPDRGLEELLETYRPRQIELVELLHADGELTDAEYAALRARLTEAIVEVPAPEASAAPPRGAPRSSGRPVEELLRTYQITTLRQAGAVRARRQISFDEYMSLKRHFAASEPGAADPEPRT
jgi:hypothetical protein